MSVCIYTIMRDERDNVARWAETTGDADLRLVVDTGSRDGTPEQLELHGISWLHAAVVPFRFDVARNLALALVPETIEWCFQVDADETLPANWRAQFEAVVDSRIPRYRYAWENHGHASWDLVMRTNLHARHGFHWRYPCHEVLVPNTPALEVPLLTVEHHPDETKPRDFYIDLLAEGVREEPNDLRMAFYFGRELVYRGMWSQARLQLMSFLELPGGWPPERAEAYRLLASIDDLPLRWLWRAVAECPDRREPWCDLARQFLRAGDGEAARAMVLMASRRNDAELYTTSRDCWGDEFALLWDECAVMA